MKHRGWLVVVVIVTVGSLLRFPLYKTVFYRTDDVVEYVNVARNIAEGKGLVQSVKFRYFDDLPVVTSAFKGRTILVAIILAGLLKINSDLYFLQLFSLMTGIVDALLLYYLARRFVSPFFAFLGGLVFVINPNLLINNRQILSEPIFLAWLLLTLIAHFVWKKPILTGVFLGLAYLTRLEGIFLLMVVLALSKKKMMTFLAFILVTLPYFWGNFLVNGNPFYTYYSEHFVVRSLREGLEGAYGRQFPTIIQFVQGNWRWILGKVVDNFFQNLKSLAEFSYLGPLTIILFLSLKKYWRKYWYLAIFSLAVLTLYALLWSGLFERGRHFIPIYGLLLLPVLGYIQKAYKKAWVWGIVTVTLLAYLVLDIHRIWWAREIDPFEGHWVLSQRESQFGWIKSNTRSMDLVSSDHSPIVNLFTDRPAILTPGNLNLNNYDGYVNYYQVKYFLVDRSDTFPLFDSKAKLAVTFATGSRIYQVK